MLSPGRPLAAQRVLGIGEDATVLRPGALRLTAHGAWTTYNELYAPGGAMPLGARLTGDSLGPSRLALLGDIQSSLRALAQTPAAAVTLGATRADLAARIARSSLTVDVGLLPRVMLTARLPYVHTRSEVTFDVNPRGAPLTANLGANPALTVPSAREQNASLVSAIAAAAQTLSTRLQSCPTAPTDPVCSDRARVEALIADARGFAGGVARTYGTGADTTPGALFVPLTGSALQMSIEQRTAAINAALQAFIPELPSFGGGPFAAQAPVTVDDVNAVLVEQLGAAPIALIERSHIGDVEVAAKVLVIDSFGGDERRRVAPSGVNLRLALGGLVRFGTGQSDTPDDFTDIGTGDGQNDIEASAVMDVLVGRRFWASVLARYGLQLADRQTVRIPDAPRAVLLGAWRQQLVDRDLGDYIELQLVPRYVYNDYLAVGALWTYRRKAEDTYTGQFEVSDPSGERVRLDARVLGMDTEQSEQRVGGGVTYSTVRAFQRGRTPIPLEIELLHTQSVSGSGYRPKRFTTQLQLRVYSRLFGAPLR